MCACSPRSRRDAIIAEIEQLRSAQLLHGFRGSPALDIAAGAHVSLVGRLMRTVPEIVEIDINPLFVHGKGEGVHSNRPFAICAHAAPARGRDMATFNMTAGFTFVNGTAVNDTFNISADIVTALGLEGEDAFICAANSFALSLDGGDGNDSFSFSTNAGSNLVSGGDGNDWAFIASGDENIVSGGADNDWIGLGGGATSTLNVLDAGDGNDFVLATADSTWLLGASGNDVLQAIGSSNALIGADGNDQLIASGGGNNLVAGDGDDWLGANGTSHH